MIKAGLLGWLRFLPLGEAALGGWGDALVGTGLAAALLAALGVAAAPEHSVTPSVVLTSSAPIVLGPLTRPRREIIEQVLGLPSLPVVVARPRHAQPTHDCGFRWWARGSIRMLRAEGLPPWPWVAPTRARILNGAGEHAL